MGNRRRLPQVLRQEQREALLACFDPAYELRDLTVVQLMLDTGLRINEATGLRFGDINFDSGRMIIHGKRSRTRIIWMNDATLYLLKRLVFDSICKDTELDKNSWIFTTAKGSRLDNSHFRHKLARLGRKIGLSWRLHPHVLRHTFASDLLHETGNLQIVQAALGHASISMTEIYTHITEEQLAEVMLYFRKQLTSV